MTRMIGLGLRHLLLILTLLLCQQAFAEHEHQGGSSGNGGDDVRKSFITIGEAIISYLETPAGALYSRTHRLDTEKLRATLTIERIGVSPTLIKDNRGSDVDARLVSTGKIELFKQAWREHLDFNRDIAYLVFHEMLRSAYGPGADDNYTVSKGLSPTPAPLQEKLSALAGNLIDFVGTDGAFCSITRVGSTLSLTTSRGVDNVFFELNETANLIRSFRKLNWLPIESCRVMRSGTKSGSVEHWTQGISVDGQVLAFIQELTEMSVDGEAVELGSRRASEFIGLEASKLLAAGVCRDFRAFQVLTERTSNRDFSLQRSECKDLKMQSCTRIPDSVQLDRPGK